MSWLNNILSDDKSNENKLSDKDIVIDLLNTSKTDINTLAKALTEAANPQLRTMLSNQLNACINDHFKLSDIAAQKSWYNPYTSPGQMIKQDLQDADTLLQNQQDQQQS